MITERKDFNDVFKLTESEIPKGNIKSISFPYLTLEERTEQYGRDLIPVTVEVDDEKYEILCSKWITSLGCKHENIMIHVDGKLLSCKNCNKTWEPTEREINVIDHFELTAVDGCLTFNCNKCDWKYIGGLKITDYQKIEVEKHMRECRGRKI